MQTTSATQCPECGISFGHKIVCSIGQQLRQTNGSGHVAGGKTEADTSAQPVSEEQRQIDLLKNDLNQKIQAAEQAAYKYFCACPLGREREHAHETYLNILYSRRTG